MVKRLKKQVNDNIRDRNFKPVNQYTVRAIEFLKSSNQPISSKALKVMFIYTNIDIDWFNGFYEAWKKQFI